MKTRTTLMLLAACGGLLACAEEDGLETVGASEDPLVIDLNNLWGTRRSDVCFMPGGGPILSAIPNMCVDTIWGSSDTGTPLQNWSCNGGPSQQWSVELDGTLRLFGKCADVNGGFTDNGTPVQLWDCNGTAAQQWQRQDNGALMNPQSGRCLDVTGGLPDSGTLLQIWDCNGTPAQQWTLPDMELSPAAQRQLRDAVLNTWVAVTPLDLTYWGPCRYDGSLYNITQVRARRGEGCFAAGNDHGRVITMDMEVTRNEPGGQDWNRGQFVHEFGHTMGFNHEQSRVDNQDGRYCQTFQGNSWQTEPRPSDPSREVDFGVYDPASVINYCTTAAPTYSLSRNDIAGVQTYYGAGSHRRSIWNPVAVQQTDKKVSAGSPALTLSVGQSWNSADGRIALKLQSNGQLGVFRTDLPGIAALWQSGTTVSSPRAEFGSNGVLVVRDGNGTSRWKSTTSSYANATLSIKQDGNVTITDTSGVVRWSTNSAHRGELDGAVGLTPGETLASLASKTTASGRFRLRLESNGNLTVYDTVKSSTVWNSNTSSLAAKSAKVSLAGNLELYNSSGAKVWTAPYTGKPGSYLALQEDGRLVAYEPAKFEIWAAGTDVTPGPGNFMGTYDPKVPALLWNGMALTAGQTLTSASGKARLSLQSNGNLVVSYQSSSGAFVTSWSTGATGGTRASLDTDGALRVYSPSNQVLFESESSYFMNSYLSISDAGKLSIYRIETTDARSIGFKY